MSDIRYHWSGPNPSVGVSKQVSLPQFQVMGYRERSKVAALTTGKVPVLILHLF